MATTTTVKFLQTVNNLIQNKNGTELAEWISLSQNSHYSPVEGEEKLERMVQNSVVETNVQEMITQSLLVRKYLKDSQLESAYTAQMNVLSKFHEYFRAQTSWLVPSLHVITYDTRIVAIMLDTETSRRHKTETHDNLRNAEQCLKKGFSLCLNDRNATPSSKKLGALFVVNQLFKIYFKLNTIRLCRNLIRVVEGPAFPSMAQFDIRDRVTYHFYVGRIAMFEDEYEKAETCLNLALAHCHHDYPKNQRLILQFLIPVKMLLGYVPSAELLAKYHFTAFQSLVQAVQVGNVGQFESVMAECQDHFVQYGIYLIVEKLRTVTYRNLVKKIFLCLDSSTRLKLSWIQTGLSFAKASTQPSELVGLDETECVLSNLIYMGYIKGYISHQQSILVLSKKEPFPDLIKVKL